MQQARLAAGRAQQQQQPEGQRLGQLMAWGSIQCWLQRCRCTTHARPRPWVLLITLRCFGQPPLR